MRLSIFGTGYVGLVSGTCFAEMGNSVRCVDVDQAKIARLEQGEIPIYEPGLAELVHDNHRAGRLRFTTDAAAAVADSEIAFICVGTPMSDSGEADLRYVESAARAIGRHLREWTLVVTKSTVPVGTAAKVRTWIQAELDRRGAAIPFAVASNPEFLKEGSAVEDFMKPDRIVIGTDSPRAEALLRELYAVFIRNGLRLYAMDIASSEMTKYAANAMLAAKISFINEMSRICEAVGADVRQVRLGAGSDSRIGMQFFHPGVGYGGSCFPKDVRALFHTAQMHGYHAEMLAAVDAVNCRQKQVLFAKIGQWASRSGRSLAGLRVAVWGLAFKPNTDDVREAPALDLIRALLAAGAQVRAHDPKAIHETQKALGAHPALSYHDDEYQAADGADVLCLVTEWRPYRRPDWRRLADLLRGRTIFDGRNQYDEKRCAEYGLTVVPIGVRAG